jgi:pyridinium-3,5-bisthiocarboxylic acid mononucleotide nickel chelatase
MRGLIFDPFAGISGDMTLGALVDLGLPGEWLKDFVAGLNLGEIEVIVERANRRGIDCGRVRFELPHEHAHRHLRHMVEIVEKVDVPDRVKERTIDAFRRIAVAEAAVHGTTVEKVHFHEVGALDAILDVLCAMAGVEQLGFDDFFTRPVAVGSGYVDIAHGRYPVPAPATLRILEGITITGLEIPGECTTPTGAAIVAALTDGRSAPTTFIAGKSGFGAGTRDPEPMPNCLRLIAYTLPVEQPGQLMLIQSDLDDLPPEYAQPAVEALMEAGALDAVIQQVTMKKGRPGLRIEALAPAAAVDAVLGALFRATSTIGARYWPVARPALPRATDEVRYEGRRIRRKIVTLPDGSTRAKPEFEDIAKAAKALNVPAWEIRRALEGEGRE